MSDKPNSAQANVDERMFVAFKDVFREHAEEAAFLWILRSRAVHLPNYDVHDIGLLDRRIDAHLLGLENAPELAWEIALEQLAHKETGEVFLAASVAIQLQDWSGGQQVADAARGSVQSGRAFANAVAWNQSVETQRWVEKLASGDAHYQGLALSVHRVLRSDPGDLLGEVIRGSQGDDLPALLVEGLRLAGELRRKDILESIVGAQSSNHACVAFWAAWAAVLCGETSAIDKLKPFVLSGDEFSSEAIELAFRVLPVDRARAWIHELLESGQTSRNAISAMGVLGDPHYLPYLAEQMNDVLVAKIAGHSYCMITGLDLADDGFATEYSSELDFQFDGESFFDSSLPLPDPDKIAVALPDVTAVLQRGQRYFLRLEIGKQDLRKVLSDGNQVQRKAASLELALANPTFVLPNTSAKLAAP